MKLIGWADIFCSLPNTNKYLETKSSTYVWLHWIGFNAIVTYITRTHSFAVCVTHNINHNILCICLQIHQNGYRYIDSSAAGCRLANEAIVTGPSSHMSFYLLLYISRCDKIIFMQIEGIFYCAIGRADIMQNECIAMVADQHMQQNAA